MASADEVVLKVSTLDRVGPMFATLAPLGVGLPASGVSRVVLLAGGAAVVLLTGIPAMRGGIQLNARGVRPFGWLFALVPWQTIQVVHPTGRSIRRGELGLQLHSGRYVPLPLSRIEDLGVLRGWVARHQTEKR